MSKGTRIHSVKRKDTDMNERQRFLEKELREYEKHTEMTSEERAALRRWVRAGNSVHENPSGAQYGGIGGLIDFLDDYRDIAEFEAEFNAMSPAEQTAFLAACHEGPRESDLYPEEVCI